MPNYLDFEDRVSGMFVGATVALPVASGAAEITLMSAVAKSLCAQRGASRVIIDIEKIVRALLESDRAHPLCNMHGARGVFNELLQRKANGGSLLRELSAADRSQGAYPLLYCAPVIIIHALQQTDPYSDVRTLVRLTHADERMTIAVLWFGRVMLKLMSRSWTPLDMCKRVEALEELFTVSKSAALNAEERSNLRSMEQRFSTVLRRVFECVFTPVSAMPRERVVSSIGREANFIEMIPLAVAIALRNVNNIDSALFDVEHSGSRDLPMLTALVGMLMGSALGLTAIKPMIRHMVTSSDESAALGLELIRSYPAFATNMF